VDFGTLEHITPENQFRGDLPLSLAVRVGKLVFVSGIPPYDQQGTIAVGSFSAQMQQAMENVTRILAAAGAGWDRVVKVNILLTRTKDFAEMNRIYSTYFLNGAYPARTTAIVASLPNPDFLLEIECQAVLK
jgi:2-iminobutanoate/2-iminopropanoate deaminase